MQRFTRPHSRHSASRASRLRARRRLATLAVLASLVSVASGCDKAPLEDTAPPEANTPTAPASPLDYRIDAEAMAADLEFLSDDALAGRHTFSPELQQAADYLAGRYAQIGLEPVVGDDVTVPFALYTGAKTSGTSHLRVIRNQKGSTSGKRTAAKSTAFVPIADGAAAKVRAPAVFVGYAAHADPVGSAPAPQAVQPDTSAEPDPHERKGEVKRGKRRPKQGSGPGSSGGGRKLSTQVGLAETRPGFDSLDGVELEGKIAVVLLDLPGQPDLRAFFEQLQRLGSDYTEAATPLIDEGEGGQAQLEKLHRAKLDELAALLRPFLRGEAMPESFFEPPETYGPELDLQSRLRPLMAMAADFPGPRFDPREGFMDRKLERLAEAGVAGVVVVRGPNTMFGGPDQIRLTPLDEKSSLGAPHPFPVVQLGWKEADALLQIDGKKLSEIQDEIDASHRPHSGNMGVDIEIDTQIEHTKVEVPNLAGMIPGTSHPDEIIVVGAHYDHIGQAGDGHHMCQAVKRRDEPEDRVCNGADDNASGTASILAIARTMAAEAKAGRGPARTVVFAHFAGEELGLWGSKALASRPELDPSKVVAMLNLDMVGRLGRKGLAIGGINSSPTWMPLLDDLGTRGMKVLYEGAVAGRSDHASFYLQGVPVLFLFTGTHADYHRAGDNFGEVNFDGMIEISELGLDIVERLADGRAIPFVAPTEGDGIASGLPGQDPATVIKTVEAQP